MKYLNQCQFNTHISGVLHRVFFPFTILLSSSFLIIFTTSISRAQEIDFGSYSTLYSITVSDLNPADNLDFGIIIKNEGIKTIPIYESKVLSVEGVKYLDVILEIDADNELLLNGNLDCIGDVTCSVPFIIQAAYSNKGMNDIGQSRILNVVNNFSVAQFPILDRGNQPPGPPPTPVYEGYDPALYMETAYLYLYGSLNVGNVQSGSYTANILVSIHYD